MILLSIGHSDAAKGAVNQKLNLNEYDLCKRMVNSAYDWLNAQSINVMVLDAKNRFPYHQYKVSSVNTLKPVAAVEFHLNSYNGTTANYSSCFYWNENYKMARLANYILANLKSAFKKHNWNSFKSVALPADGYDMDRYWWITETKYPSMIVEPLFLSNPEQAAWLASSGACEAVGLVIAEGIFTWLNGEKLISK